MLRPKFYFEPAGKTKQKSLSEIVFIQKLMSKFWENFLHKKTCQKTQQKFRGDEGPWSFQGEQYPAPLKEFKETKEFDAVLYLKSSLRIYKYNS